MKKLLLLLAIFAALCSPAYAVKQKRPHTYQEKTGVYQKRKRTYTRNTPPVTPEYTEEKKRREQNKPAEVSETEQQSEKTPREIREQKKLDKQRSYNPYALPNISAAATVNRRKPEIKIEVERKELEFVMKDGVFKCGDMDAAGCTHYSQYIQIEIDCSKPKITLKGIELEAFIELNKQYPKGSCRFDTVLKHELTHLTLHRKAQKIVLDAAAQEAASVFEAMQQKASCSEIETVIFALERKYDDIFWKEDRKQNALIDGKGHYDYQWEQCHGKD